MYLAQHTPENSRYKHTTAALTEVPAQNLLDEVSIRNSLQQKAPLGQRSHRVCHWHSPEHSSSSYSSCHMQPPWVTTQVGEISVRGEKKNHLYLLFLVHGTATQTWHSNGTTAAMCSPELVILYTIKERHLFTQSRRAGLHVLHSPVSLIMHRKVQISHLLLFSGKSNTACPLPHWHSSHPNHLPIPSCTCLSLEPISITSFKISIQDFKTCQIC